MADTFIDADWLCHLNLPIFALAIDNFSGKLRLCNCPEVLPPVVTLFFVISIFNVSIRDRTESINIFCSVYVGAKYHILCDQIGVSFKSLKKLKNF